MRTAEKKIQEQIGTNQKRFDGIVFWTSSLPCGPFLRKIEKSLRFKFIKFKNTENNIFMRTGEIKVQERF